MFNCLYNQDCIKIELLVFLIKFDFYILVNFLFMKIVILIEIIVINKIYDRFEFSYYLVEFDNCMIFLFCFQFVFMLIMQFYDGCLFSNGDKL